MFRRSPKKDPAWTALSPTGPVEFMVAGLGNPGRKYAFTRHNAGFLAVDALAARYGVKMEKIRFQSLCGDAAIMGRRVLLVKPSAFMNLSGQAVREAAAFYKIPPERVIVVMDDVSLPVGRMRVRTSGSDGGHNGLRNILYLMGADNIPRIRIGVGAKPRPDFELADWVLSEFSDEELGVLDTVFQNTAGAVELLIRGEAEEAMSRYNGVHAGEDARPKDPEPKKAKEGPHEISF